MLPRAFEERRLRSGIDAVTDKIDPPDSLEQYDNATRRDARRFALSEFYRVSAWGTWRNEANTGFWCAKAWIVCFLVALAVRAAISGLDRTALGAAVPLSAMMNYGIYIFVLTFGGGIIGLIRGCSYLGAFYLRSIDCDGVDPLLVRRVEPPRIPPLQRYLLLPIVRHMTFGGLILGVVLEIVWWLGRQML